jgi:hypothetical protein
MEIKVQCECGTRFAFDVEPVNGRMPVRVSCPDCGADRTDYANEMIRQQLGPAAAPARPVAVAVVAAPLPTAIPVPTAAPAPARQPIRVAASPPAPVAVAAAIAAAPAAAAASVTYCPRHLKSPAVEACRVCGKPICEECMATYGYVCSTFCRKRAEETRIELPVYARQRSVIEARITRLVTRIVWAVALLVALALGTWIWYAFWGSRPRVVYSEKLPHGDRARFYQLLVPDQVLSIKTTQMSLFDVTQQKQLWSIPLDVGFIPPPPPDPSRPSIEEQVELYPEPRVMASTNDLWILFPKHLIQYDRRSGNRKQEIPVNPYSSELVEGADGLTIISTDESDRRVITRIRFADGTVQTEPIDAPKPATPPPAARSKSSPGPPGTAAAKTFAAATNILAALARTPARESYRDRFKVDGAGVVQVKLDLIERKTVMRQAMKQPKKSLVDDNLTAGQSLDAVVREMNEARRETTGGVEEEDASRYRVTLRRLPAGTAPDWTGEAIGPPAFYPLKNLGVLVSGKMIQVFDKNNKRLWGANLTYPVSERYSSEYADEAEPPCVEAGNTLYVFDKGMLTSFDAATGDVRWRLTSVGISQVQLDEKGNLYVSSTTASPDSIQFSQEFDPSARSAPVILKVAAATGKVLWRNEGFGDTCYLSGKYVYIARATESPLVTIGEDPILNFDIYRLNPSDGRLKWNYSQPRHPVQVEVQGKLILLHFRGELQVLKYRSL